MNDTAHRRGSAAKPLKDKVFTDHRFHERHRARHCPRTRGRRLRGRSQWLRQARKT